MRWGFLILFVIGLVSCSRQQQVPSYISSDEEAQTLLRQTLRSFWQQGEYPDLRGYSAVVKITIEPENYMIQSFPSDLWFLNRDPEKTMGEPVIAKGMGNINRPLSLPRTQECVLNRECGIHLGATETATRAVVIDKIRLTDDSTGWWFREISSHGIGSQQEDLRTTWFPREDTDRYSWSLPLHMRFEAQQCSFSATMTSTCGTGVRKLPHHRSFSQCTLWPFEFPAFPLVPTDLLKNRYYLSLQTGKYFIFYIEPVIARRSEQTERPDPLVGTVIYLLIIDLCRVPSSLAAQTKVSH